MSNCSHGMPNPKTCYDCMEEGNLEPPKWERKGNAWFARFESTCPGCNKTISMGETVYRWDKEDKNTTYTHVFCSPKEG